MASPTRRRTERSVSVPRSWATSCVSRLPTVASVSCRKAKTRLSAEFGSASRRCFSRTPASHCTSEKEILRKPCWRFRSTKSIRRGVAIACTYPGHCNGCHGRGPRKIKRRPHLAGDASGSRCRKVCYFPSSATCIDRLPVPFGHAIHDGLYAGWHGSETAYRLRRASSGRGAGAGFAAAPLLTRCAAFWHGARNGWHTSDDDTTLVAASSAFASTAPTPGAIRIQAANATAAGMYFGTLRRDIVDSFPIGRSISRNPSARRRRNRSGGLGLAATKRRTRNLAAASSSVLIQL